MEGNDARERQHCNIFRMALGLDSLSSEKVRWYRQASKRLEPTSAVIYMSIFSGSVSNGFAVRTYLRISGVGFSDRERASKILDV